MESYHQEEIPEYIIEALARMILPEVREFYESEEGKEYFEKWKAESTPDLKRKK